MSRPSIEKGKCLQCGHWKHHVCYDTGFFGETCLCAQFIPRGTVVPGRQKKRREA